MEPINLKGKLMKKILSCLILSLVIILSTSIIAQANHDNGMNIFAQNLNPGNDLDFIGQHYDFVLTAYPSKADKDQLRLHNPNLPIFLFINPFFEWGDFFWNAQTQQEHNNMIEYFAQRTDAGNLMTYNGPSYPQGTGWGSNVPLMDMMKVEWHDYLVWQISKHLGLSEMDGVFFDTMDETIASWAISTSQEYPANYTAQAWKDKQYEFLGKTVQQQLEDSKETWTNSSTRIPNQSLPLPNQLMRDWSHGQAFEAYSEYLSYDSHPDIKWWLFWETMMNDVVNITTSENKKLLIEVSADSGSEEIRIYALTSFLLVQNEKSYFYFTTQANAGTLVWQPEWDVDIGDATDSVSVLTDNVSYFVMQRNFENGKVLVNPNSIPMTVPISGYNDWHGNPIGPTLVMQPYTGMILLNN